MGRQVNFDFDEADEQLIIEQLQQAESWVAMTTPTPIGAKWRSLESRGKVQDLLLVPARLVPKIEIERLNDPEQGAGQMLVWTRTGSPNNGEVVVGKARIWFDTSRTTDSGVKKAFGALARLIAAHSPRFAGAGGAPIYIGPHLASQFESGALRARWPNGELAKLQPNPRLKKPKLKKRTSRQARPP